MTLLHVMVGLTLWWQAGAVAAQPGAGWAGTWTGTLANYPARGTPSVQVTREIGVFPSEVGACVPWKTTYTEPGKPPQSRAYQLCRGAGPNEFVIDEGGGVRLSATWLGDVLVSTFTYDTTLLTSVARVRGNVFEEEIFTAPVSTSTTGIHSLTTRTLQRLTLTRRE